MSTDAKEIQYTVTSDFMTENPATCTSVMSATRVKKDHWKGMNDDQRKGVLDGMDQQVEEKRRKKLLEKEAEALWAAQEEAKREELIKKTLEKQRKERDMAAGLLEMQKTQKSEKDARWTNYYGEKLPHQKPTA